MDNIITFNNIITIVSFIVNIAFIIPFIISIYNYFSKKRYINKILEFDNNIAYITHSSCYFSSDIECKNEYEYITYELLASINNIIKLFHIVNKKFNLIDNYKDSKNEVNIGGFLTNKKVNAYFIKHFRNLKYIVNDNHKNRYSKYPINHELIEYSSDKTGFQIGNNIFLETNNTTDYAFVIKMKRSDFKDDNGKTVHILFGAGREGTVKASEYLTMYYKQIYNKYKNNHYFFALEVNRIDNSINFARGIIDLTNIMFQDDAQ